MTICPTYKLIRGLVSSFDEDSDLTLTADEKAVLLTTVATNPDIAIQRLALIFEPIFIIGLTISHVRLVLNQKLQFPVLPYFGSCGRIFFKQGPHKPLSSFVQESLPIRLDLGMYVPHGFYDIL